MKYTIRTPGPNNYGDEFLHAVVRVTATHYRSICGHCHKERTPPPCP